MKQEWCLEMIKNVMQRIQKQQNGVLLASVLIITAVLLVVSFSLTSLAISQYAISNNKVFSANALMVAEAGIEQAVKEINEDENFGGHSTEQEFFNNATQGRGTYTTTITAMADTNAKQIVSTGNVYRFNKTEVESSRIVKVTIVGTSSEGYAVHTGPGGLVLGGSTNVTNTDVFVNGNLSMSGSARIGTHAQPVNVSVAHQSCPSGPNPGSTYPQVCSSGEPISFNGNSTRIYGTVCATNQTSSGPANGGNILPGSDGQGLQLGCTAPPVSTPTYSRQNHINNVTTTANANDYGCQGSKQKTLTSNLQLNGNLSISGSCEMSVQGNVYITGNLSISGSTRLRVADSVGANRPVIVVDGTISVSGSTQLIANSSGTGIHFISYKTTAACNPNCSSVTGTDLKTSQDLETVSVSGSVNMPGMIFHAYWSKVSISGSGSLGSAIGQTVNLSGSGTITFGTELSSGVRTWTITSYQQDFPE